MHRYRLAPTPEQEARLRDHCAHARFIWNLAVEQNSWYSRRRSPAPRYVEQCRQLTEARAENVWLAAGSQGVQQQALRDFDRAMRAFFEGGRGLPGWRKAGRNEGFRIVAVRPWQYRRLSRKVGEVRIPKVGWVRFRWSRPVPGSVKSYSVTLDRAGRWHIGFRTIPAAIEGPGTGEVLGIDRGVVVSAALSTGEMLSAPRLGPAAVARHRRLRRKLSRARRGSNRRARVKLAAARLRAAETDARKDWCEKTSTELARRFDVIRVEDLRIGRMTRAARGSKVAAKAGLNREILASGWGLLVKRLEDKAAGRIERIDPRFTSQRCSACGHVDPKSRKSQADFVCTACGYACNADLNAAKNIAAGHAVNARGGDRVAGPVNREPQIAA